MINYLKGTIQHIQGKEVTLVNSSIGFCVRVPNPESLTLKQQAEFFIYLHWNADAGPSLYGFATQTQRTIFLLIIDSPKIGPKIALSILSQMTPEAFINAIISSNEKSLSTINGLGIKKAEQLITHLKHKIKKYIDEGIIKSEGLEEDFSNWQQLNEALVSLGYTKQEISKAHSYLIQTNNLDQESFDQLLRRALSLLSSRIER